MEASQFVAKLEVAEEALRRGDFDAAAAVVSELLPAVEDGAVDVGLENRFWSWKPSPRTGRSAPIR